MIRLVYPLVVTACLVAALQPAARAEDTDAAAAKAELDAAKAELDALEKEGASLAKGDGAATKALRKKLSALQNKLYNSKHKDHADWIPLVKRSVAIDDGIVANHGAAPPAATPDDATRKAIELLAQAEKELETSGDKAAAKLSGTPGRARSGLMGASAPARRSSEWIEALARADMLAARLKKPGAEGGAAPGEKAVAAEAIKLEAGERAPDDAGAKTRSTGAFYPELDRCARELAKATPKDFVNEDAARSHGFAVERLEKALAAVKGWEEPWCRKWVELYKKRVEELTAEGKKSREAAAAAAASEKKDVDAELADLDGYFDPKSFKTELEPPYTEARVREWIGQLKSWNASGAKGLATLDRFVKEHPSFANDARVTGLRRWFKTGLAKAVDHGIGKTFGRYETGSGTADGVAAWRIAEAKTHLEPDGLKGWPLTDDATVEKLLVRLAQGIEACEGKILFAKEYLEKPDADHVALLPRLRELRAKVEKDAKTLFENARMPEARSTDATLAEIAKKAIADYGTAATSIKRLVVVTEKQHHVENRKSSHVEGEFLVIRSWTEEYDFFHVATAEKVGDDWRIAFYDLRRYTKALKGESTHEWYCSDRREGKRIPEANIAK